jgi:predicted methyltransferase
MNKLFVVGAITALIASTLASGEASDSSAVSKAIVAAVGDSTRPATDTVRDADRKPVKTLEFAGVKPADPRTAGVFDKSIRGHTDQFILKFSKPEA